MPDETPQSASSQSNAQAHPASGTPAPQTVAIPLEQLQAFTAAQARLALLEGEQRARESSAREEQAKILAQKGEVENALKLLRDQSEHQLAAERSRLSAVEERAKRYALDGELSRALSSQPLVPGGAEQLTRLFRHEFLVDSQGDSFTVRTPTFQSVGDFVRAQLERPEYAHFVRAQAQGGTAGTTGAHQTTPTPPSAPTTSPVPKTLGEAVILQMQTKKKDELDPRLNLGSSFGLRGTGR